jgi:P-type conjugative transfer protein TrbG
MIKLLLNAAVIAACATCVPAVGQDITKADFFSESAKLSDDDKFALESAEKWANSQNAPKPKLTEDGSLTFVYGLGRPTVVCAVLEVCDIALQPGERVGPNGIHIGDPRFTIEPALTGTAPFQQLHIIVKPQDAGLDTTLIVTTDRRTYHIRLKSHQKDFMPKVRFAYREDAQAKWAAIQAQQQTVVERNTIPQTGENIENLDFSYNVKGKAPWKPLRVYNNGQQTIIQLPEYVHQHDAPTLVILEERGLFRADEQSITNSRLRNNRIIVDMVFDKAALITGAGSNQTRVIIERDKKSW